MPLVHALNGGGILLVQLISSVQINLKIKMYSATFIVNFFLIQFSLFFGFNFFNWFISNLKPDRIDA